MIAPVRLEPTPYQPGARSDASTLTHVEADVKLRPLHDRLIIEPLDVVHSRRIFVVEHNRPVRGRVLAAGPGVYPKHYDHAEKHKRSKMRESQVFRPTTVRPGDLVELGGSEIGGYAFEGFFWGDKYCIWATERDVCGIVEE